MARWGPGMRSFWSFKKKYNGVVYKRRISISEERAAAYMAYRLKLPQDSQIGREIAYCCDFYGSLQPSVYLCYDRTALYSAEDPNLRLTFDQNIRFRRER